jgi:acyl-CoA synthetase (AMP-forming)/AMP-acid ligase II
MSSGDMGHFDENGLLFVDGRDDDMIVSGGENVFPQEVENPLVEGEDVSDAAVVGVEDSEFGKRLRAFIVSHGQAAAAGLDRDGRRQVRWASTSVISAVSKPISSGPPSGGRRVRRNVVDAGEVVAGIDIQPEVGQGSDDRQL